MPSVTIFVISIVFLVIVVLGIFWLIREDADENDEY